MVISCKGRRRGRVILTTLALWASWCFATTAPADDAADARFNQADALRTKDHARFVVMLDALHHDMREPGPGAARYLRFLDGWEANYEGRYPEAEKAFREVIAETDDDTLGTRATALLMNNLTGQGKYSEAYAMAPRAADTLPAVTNAEARVALLANLSQMLTFAGQPELGLKYAEMMVAATPGGSSLCPALAQKVIALEGARQVTSQSPELQKTIDLCRADHQSIFADAIALVRVDRLIDEHKLADALVAVKRMAPAIQAGRYFPHLIDLASARADLRTDGQQRGGTEGRARNDRHESSW